MASPTFPCHCGKCNKTIDASNFYTLKTGERSDLCKACETMHINNWEPDTFLWLLEKYDVPYLPWEWNTLRDRAYAKDPYKMTGMSVFGKYLSKMKLKQFAFDKVTGQPIGWKDTDRLQEEHEKEIAALGFNDNNYEEKLANMKEMLEKGEITQAQYDTYAESTKPEPSFEIGLAPGGGTAIYKSDELPFENVEIPDPGKNLTEEDKVYLAVKWGRYYSAAEWVSLEEKYHEYEKSFDLHNADLISGTIQLCKLDLKCNQALDTGDIDAYSKLARASDSLRKSMKFTEAQRKEEKESEYSCYGQIVAFVEKMNDEDYIRPIDLSVDRDIVDADIRDIKNFTRSLIEEDPAVFKLIEQYIKKREILAEQEQDEENGYQLTDKDLTDYNHQVEIEKAASGYESSLEGEEEV